MKGWGVPDWCKTLGRSTGRCSLGQRCQEQRLHTVMSLGLKVPHLQHENLHTTYLLGLIHGVNVITSRRQMDRCPPEVSRHDCQYHHHFLTVFRTWEECSWLRKHNLKPICFYRQHLFCTCKEHSRRAGEFIYSEESEKVKSSLSG